MNDEALKRVRRAVLNATARGAAAGAQVLNSSTGGFLREDDLRDADTEIIDKGCGVEIDYPGYRVVVRCAMTIKKLPKS